MMLETDSPTSPTIVRTERGLTVAGTRVTLYDVLAHLKAEWPVHLMQHWLNLSAEQLDAALTYINTHRDEVEAEYRQVLDHAAANRQYWEARNKERLARIAQLPPPPDAEAVIAKLKARKAARGDL